MDKEKCWSTIILHVNQPSPHSRGMGWHSHDVQKWHKASHSLSPPSLWGRTVYTTETSTTGSHTYCQWEAKHSCWWIKWFTTRHNNFLSATSTHKVITLGSWFRSVTETHTKTYTTIQNPPVPCKYWKRMRSYNNSEGGITGTSYYLYSQGGLDFPLPCTSHTNAEKGATLTVKREACVLYSRRCVYSRVSHYQTHNTHHVDTHK